MLAAAGTALMMVAIYGFFALRFSMGLIDSLLAPGFLLVALQIFKWQKRNRLLRNPEIRAEVSDAVAGSRKSVGVA
jgi:hypothetical protein